MPAILYAINLVDIGAKVSEKKELFLVSHMHKYVLLKYCV